MNCCSFNLIIKWLMGKCKELYYKYYNIKEMVTYNNKVKYNLYWKYLMYLKFYPIFIDIREKQKLIKTEIVKDTERRAILCKNKSIEELKEIIDKVKIDKNGLEKMYNNRYLINRIKLNNISIKDIIDKYPDKNKDYDHTLNNICEVEGIEYDDGEYIHIEYIDRKNLVRLVKDIKMGDIKDKHIMEIYDKI